tara:strand:- start:647 stop:1816 length:1170 start_codon:yes stop_codon:yes gene_type:complete
MKIMKFYQKISSNFSLCLLLFFIGNMFIFLIPNSYFPDYKSIEDALNNKHNNSLFLTLQYLILFIKTTIQSFFNYLLNANTLEPITLNIFSRQIFFLINILFILILPLLDSFFNQKSHIRTVSNQNLIYFTSLLYPSVLLSITASSAESIYSIISIFLISRLINFDFKILKFIFYFILLIYAFFLDKGNWLIFTSFLLFYFSTYFIKNKLDDLKLTMLILVLVVIAKTLSANLIEYVGFFFNVTNNFQTIEAINLLGLNDIEFLEVFKRYLYYWGTLLGIVTHHKNIVFSILIFILIIIIIIRKKILQSRSIINFNFSIIENKINTYLIFCFPIIIIIILPTHAFAKYYLFFIPIFLHFLLKFIDKNMLVLNVFLISLISISHQFIYFI